MSHEGTSTIQLTTLSKRVNDEPRETSIQLELRGADEPIDDDADGSDDDDEEHYPDGGVKAYSVILGCFLGNIVNLGLINSIGAIQAYVSVHQLQNLKQTSISWIFSIYLCLAFGGGIITGPLFDKHGPLAVLIASTAFIFLGLMGSAQSVEIWQFILSFISLGIGNGLGMTPLVGVISQWFSKKRGNCTGLATSGGSVGGLVFPLMLRHLYSEYGYVWAIRVLAFVCLGCMIAAILLVKGRSVSGTNNSNNADNDDNDNNASVVSTSVWKKLKAIRPEPKFAYLIAGAILGELSLMFVVTYYASYAISKGASESTSYLLLTIWNASGTLGRWLPAYISDFYGRFNINILMLTGYTLCMFVLWYPFGSDIKVLYAVSVLGGYFQGSISSMLPVCLLSITPVREIGTKYGILNTILSFVTLFGIPIGSIIIKNGTSDEYNQLVIFIGCISFGSVMFWYFSRFAIVGSRLNVKV